jgi:hypothetical protein
MSGMGKWMVRLLSAMVMAAGSLVSLADPAQAYDFGDCAYLFGAANVFRADQFYIDTGWGGLVDFGDDPHLFGGPQGRAVVCWSIDGRVAIRGRVYADYDNPHGENIEATAQITFFDARGARGTIICGITGHDAASAEIYAVTGPEGTTDEFASACSVLFLSSCTQLVAPPSRPDLARGSARRISYVDRACFEEHLRHSAGWPGSRAASNSSPLDAEDLLHVAGDRAYVPRRIGARVTGAPVFAAGRTDQAPSLRDRRLREPNATDHLVNGQFSFWRTSVIQAALANGRYPLIAEIQTGTLPSNRYPCAIGTGVQKLA